MRLTWVNSTPEKVVHAVLYRTFKNVAGSIHLCLIPLQLRARRHTYSSRELLPRQLVRARTLNPYNDIVLVGIFLQSTLNYTVKCIYLLKIRISQKLSYM